MAAVVKVYHEKAAWVEAAAAEVFQSVDCAVRGRGFAVVLLSGGRTPLPVYRRLALPPWDCLMPWGKIHFFWADERWVPPEDPESNYGMAWQSMLSRVPAKTDNIHRISTDCDDPVTSACEYELEWRRFAARYSERIDLAIMGMGEDGHLASLFPGDPAVAETVRLVAAVRSPTGIENRITVTFPLLNGSGDVIFLVTGAEKRPMLEKVLGNNAAVKAEIPVAMIRPRGRVLWILDGQAALIHSYSDYVKKV